MRRILRHAGVASSVLSGLLVAACSGGGEGFPRQPDLTMAPDLAPSSSDMKDNDYPPGPYGSNIGDTLPDFTFQGYWSPQQTQGRSNVGKFGEVTFGMMHRSGAKYALIELGAFY
jgi:hypothetical protein